MTLEHDLVRGHPPYKDELDRLAGALVADLDRVSTAVVTRVLSEIPELGAPDNEQSWETTMASGVGQRGFLPLSLNLGEEYVRDHWPMDEQGAAEAGRVADRSAWRVVRDVFVTDTDEEAYRRAAEGMARMTDEYVLLVLRSFGLIPFAEARSGRTR